MRNIKYIGTKPYSDAFFDKTGHIWTPGKVDTVLDDVVAAEMLKYPDQFEDAGDVSLAGTVGLNAGGVLEIGGVTATPAQKAEFRDAVGSLNTAYPYGVISDDVFSGWTKLAGGGNSLLEQSPIQGFSTRVTTNGVSSGYVVAQKKIAPLVLSASDVVSIRLNIVNANNTRNVRITLSNDVASTIRAYIVGYQTWHPGNNVMSFKISDCIFAGGATASTVWNYLQIDVVNPAYATQTVVDIGHAYVGGAAKVPLVTIGFDAGYSKVYEWAFPSMKAAGILGHIYAKPSSIGLSTHMSVEQYREVYSAGWSIGRYVNVDNMGANNHTKDGVCLSQPVTAGGSFNVNGSLSSGGVVTLQSARVITAYIASGNEGTNAFTITGTDISGSSISETIMGPTGSATKAYTSKSFKTVSGVTSMNATTVDVSIGTGFTQDEYINQYNIQQEWFELNGFTRGAKHFAFALGEFNHESEHWLKAVGMKTARTVTTGTGLMRNQVQGIPVNELFLSCAVTMGDPSSNTSIQTQVNNAITRGHDVNILAHLGGAITPDKTELDSTLAWLGGLHRSGAIRVVPFDVYETIKGL